jgi:hypothetical protein
MLYVAARMIRGALKAPPAPAPDLDPGPERP